MSTLSQIGLLVCVATSLLMTPLANRTLPQIYHGFRTGRSGVTYLAAGLWLLGLLLFAVGWLLE